MYKGFGGMGGGNMQNLMRQAQKMQEEMLRKQQEADEKLESTVLSASSGGGMVTVEITGTKKITAVKINPAAVDPDDVEMLEDMVLACVNEAITKATELEKELKPDLLGGMM